MKIKWHSSYKVGLNNICLHLRFMSSPSLLWRLRNHTMGSRFLWFPIDLAKGDSPPEDQSKRTVNWVFIAPIFSLRVHEGQLLTEGHSSYQWVLSTHSLRSDNYLTFHDPSNLGVIMVLTQPTSSSIVFLLNPSQMISVWLCLLFPIRDWTDILWLPRSEHSIY